MLLESPYVSTWDNPRPVSGHHLETVELADTNPSNSARHTEHQLMRTNAPRHVPLRRHRSSQAIDTCAHLPAQLHTCHVPPPPTSITNSARHRYTCIT